MKIVCPLHTHLEVLPLNLRTQRPDNGHAINHNRAHLLQNWSGQGLAYPLDSFQTVLQVLHFDLEIP